MGKRILIISYYFAPQNAIGAVRPTKLAKYLARMGHEVTVLCGPGMNGRRDPTLERDLRELKDVRVIREWNPLRSRQARAAGVVPAGGAGAPAAARVPLAAMAGRQELPPPRDRRAGRTGGRLRRGVFHLCPLERA